MPVAINGDLEIHYTVSGEGDPLVLIMGLGADESVWQDHRSEYEKHFKCIAIDNRCVGASSKLDQPFSTRDMAKDVLAVMDAEDVKTAHVAGISMGGTIAQELCLEAAGRVRSLILISTWARLGEMHKSVFDHFKFVRSLASPQDFMTCLQLWIWGPDWFETNLSDLLQARADARQNPEPQPQFGFARQCDACINHDTLDRLDRIQCPTLVTAGDKDIFTPLELSRALKERIPNSELLVFENCAHTHHWEDLERFNRVTLEFLKRN